MQLCGSLWRPYAGNRSSQFYVNCSDSQWSTGLGSRSWWWPLKPFMVWDLYIFWTAFPGMPPEELYAEDTRTFWRSPPQDTSGSPQPGPESFLPWLLPGGTSFLITPKSCGICHCSSGLVKENCSIRHLVEGSNGYIVWHSPDCLFPPSPPTIDLVGARYYAIILLLFLDLILTLIELYNLYVVCHFEPGFSRKSCLKIKLIC